MRIRIMKASELMIGDWVEVTNSDHLKYVQVDGILDNSIFTKEGEYESEEVSLDMIKPILLTQEILEKNGFPRNKDEEDKYYCKDKDTYRLYDFDSKYPYFRLIEVILPNEHYFWVEDHCTIKIHYVHEFQHLLKLCKIKKDIIL